MLPGTKKKLLKRVSDYKMKLSAGDSVSRDEVIAAQLAQLALEKDIEKRLLILKTLADLDFEGILPYAVKELVSYTKQSKAVDEGYYRVLLNILFPDLGQSDELLGLLREIEPDVEKIKEIVENVPLSKEGIDVLATVASLKSFQNAVRHLRRLIETQNEQKYSEREYQEILAANPWLLGSQYTELLVKEFWIDTSARIDLMLASALGHVDLVELKRPDTKILMKGSRPNTWRASPELSDVLAQARKYLQILDENRLLIESKHPFSNQSVSRLYRSGVIIVAGRTPTEREARNALRDMNVSEHRTLILTYDDVIAVGEATIKIFEHKLQPPDRLLQRSTDV